MKVMITGASGFSGLHACDYLRNTGYDVIAVTRKTPITSSNVHVEYCDLTDYSLVEKLIQKTKPQYILHLAGQNHVGRSWANPLESLNTNVMSTVHLLEALRKECPSSRIVVIGSALQFELNNKISLPHPYSLSKTLQVLIAQAWHLLYDMNIVIAKPSNLIGPGHSNGVCSIFAKKIVDMENNISAERILAVNNLKVRRDFVDVRDAVKGYELLLKYGIPGELYEISSGITRSLEEVIQTLKAHTNVDFQVRTENNHDVNDKIITLPDRIKYLGWGTKIDFSTSIADILEFYRQNDDCLSEG